MCGIAGVVLNDRNAKVDEQTLHSMNRALYHRGPDNSGHLIDQNAGLAHRRLSIIDLSENGRQPFSSQDGRFHIIFNGEIYNYKELKQKLDNSGFVFKSLTDTEVLLNLFIRYGASMLDMLNGMFAFAIWDSVERSLFMARDRLGVKPFYYHANNIGFYFASEPKAIFATGIELQLDENKLDELLLFRYVAGEEMIFKNINRLLPGHFAVLKNSQLFITRWWNLSTKVLADQTKNLNYQDLFQSTFNSSIQYRMISDVPVGILLSGGVDSGAVAASIAGQGYKDVSAFTVTFDQFDYNEGPLAKKVAQQFQMEYHELKVTGTDLFDCLADTIWYNDEPLAHQNDPHLHAMAKYAKKFVTVLQSGEGSDELMAGYVRYMPLSTSVKLNC